ncbi:MULTISPECIES: helix-turn-helix domain-containing protein [Myroides]|uniref:Helix-turn-helix domain-containing protein n=1 Tax=Myroides albus TaxID=2562892 RepID=A0A6I3LHZ0_9FLAO|nr:MULTISPECIES: helix-turn-helix transcriptional regulator [Myroides]MTG97414.1 helix-turn-helix domain-containing protein [Myroides albus]MVX35090.1 helix-turn-helix domain-containing protein [Myroides sp. LoEW2-1]UVD79443.1 helix-turn-helix transcriptional regulator [Myroides albus]
METNSVLHIKNMVCHRCVLVVDQELKKLGVLEATVTLGKVILHYPLASSTMLLFEKKLQALGFELIKNRRGAIVEQIKNLVIKIVDADEKLAINMSYYLSEQLDVEYSYASKLFSESEGITIERYYILLRIERVKEYISYGELSLVEIATKLYYNDLSHMSKQFKNVMGVSPSKYKKDQVFQRNHLDKIIT